MPTITLTLPVAGNQITAGLHATNYSTLQTLLNGGLDQSNISTAATPTMASLTLTGIAGLVLSGNGGKDTLNLSNTTADVGMTIGGDVTLYRGAANSLRTDDTFRIVRSVAGDNSLETLVSGDAQLRHYITAGGDHWWGGGATAADTNLYRSAADTLNTDDAFTAALNITSAADILARSGAAAQVKMGSFGPAAEAGIVFGAAADVNLYRSAANTLSLGADDKLVLGTGGIQYSDGTTRTSENAVYAKVRKTAAQSISSTTSTLLTFDSESADSFGFHDNATNNTRLTVPAGYGGVYFVHGRVVFAANTTGARAATILLNGTGVANVKIAPNPTGSEQTTVEVCAIIAATAGQYFELSAYQVSGGALDVAVNDTGLGGYTELSCYRIGS